MARKRQDFDDDMEPDKGHGNLTEFEKSIVSVETMFQTEKTRCKLFIKILDPCNYDCDYCCNFDGEEVPVTKLPDLLKLTNYIKAIDAEKIFFYIYGGEPTLHNGLIPFCRGLLDTAYDLGKEAIMIIQTNASWKEKKIADFRSYFKEEEEVKFALSYHPTETDFEQMLTAAKAFQKYDMIYGLSMLLPSFDMFDRIKIEYEMFRRELGDVAHITPTFQIVNQIPEHEEYLRVERAPDEILVKYLEDGEIKSKGYTVTDLIGNRMLHFKGMECSGANAFFDTDGNVYKCMAAFGSGHKVCNYITDENFEESFDKFSKLINNAMTCIYDTCICDLFPKKYKKGYE